MVKDFKADEPALAVLKRVMSLFQKMLQFQILHILVEEEKMSRKHQKNYAIPLVFDLKEQYWCISRI